MAFLLKGGPNTQGYLYPSRPQAAICSLRRSALSGWDVFVLASAAAQVIDANAIVRLSLQRHHSACPSAMSSVVPLSWRMASGFHHLGSTLFTAQTASQFSG